jgi:GrpB-like predicted nucleotidyltransferase (UPF0157 family)
LSYRVHVVPYNSQWRDRYALEEPLIRQAMGVGNVVDIQHVGSTSVPGLAAKPVIDILVGVRGDLVMSDEQKAAMATLGYEYRDQAGVEGRLFLRKGGANRSHHCHVVEWDGVIWREHLLFRDYLRTHPAECEAYAVLKGELAGRFADDRARYTESKAPLIQAMLERARAWEAAQ